VKALPETFRRTRESAASAKVEIRA
jgi:hypothetical protein